MKYNDLNISALRKGELAAEYSPELTSSAARKRLNAWLRFHPTVLRSLRATGWNERRRYLTPRQISIIFDALGEP